MELISFKRSGFRLDRITYTNCASPGRSSLSLSLCTSIVALSTCKGKFAMKRAQIRVCSNDRDLRSPPPPPPSPPSRPPLMKPPAPYFFLLLHNSHTNNNCTPACVVYPMPWPGLSTHTLCGHLCYAPDNVTFAPLMTLQVVAAAAVLCRVGTLRTTTQASRCG